MIQRDLLGEPMRLLAVRQPWASLLVLGHKPIENRTWSTDYRGRVAILASRRPDKSSNALEAIARYLPATRLDHLPFGAIIGSVELYGITQSMQSWWFTGPYGFLMRDAKQLKRGIPYRGQLGLVACPAHIRNAVLTNK